MIQVTTNGFTNSSPNEYPKLMISEMGRIVLFFDYKRGIVLYEKDQCWDIGHNSEAWDIEKFKPMNTPVTIQNV